MEQTAWEEKRDELRGAVEAEEESICWELCHGRLHWSSELSTLQS
jgi:hypothetical protein